MCKILSMKRSLFRSNLVENSTTLFHRHFTTSWKLEYRITDSNMARCLQNFCSRVFRNICSIGTRHLIAYNKTTNKSTGALMVHASVSPTISPTLSLDEYPTDVEVSAYISSMHYWYEGRWMKKASM